MSQSNKAKHKQHRKAIRIAELNAQRKKKQTIDKWVRDWYESRPDYPVTKAKKKLTWQEIKRFILRKKQKSKNK